MPPARPDRAIPFLFAHALVERPHVLIGQIVLGLPFERRGFSEFVYKSESGDSANVAGVNIAL
jgi:hypothetical protein